MMGLIYSPDLLNKPRFGTRLNPYNPLTCKLSIALPFNEPGGLKTYSLADEQLRGTLSGGAKLAVSSHGWGLYTGGETDAACTINTTSGYTGDFTICFGIFIFSEPSNYTRLVSNDQFELWRSNGNKQLSLWNAKNTSAIGTPENSVLINNYYDIGVRRPSSGNPSEIYINGILNCSGDGQTPTSATNPMQLMNNAAGGEPSPVGTMYYFYLWDRLLNIGEIQAIHENPWRMYMPEFTSFAQATAASRCFTNTPLNSGIFNSAIR